MTECVSDTHCACGQYCYLGRCQEDCSANKDCDGGYCDDQGRCRASADRNAARLIPDNAEGKLVPAQLSLNAESLVDGQLITLNALSGDVSKARVVAPEGFLVALAEIGVSNDDLSYSQELIVPEVPAGKSAQIVLRPDSDTWRQASGDESGLKMLKVIDARGTRSNVTIKEPVQTLIPLRGSYEGTARLTSTSAQPLDVDTNISVTARVFWDGASNTAPIEIHDPAHVLHPSGIWVGTLERRSDESGAWLSLTLPSAEVKRPSMIATRDTHVVAVPQETTIALDPDSTDFTGNLPIALQVAYQGLTGRAESAPRAVWKLSLSRKGDLPVDAAPAPANEPAVLAINAKQEEGRPFPQEVAYRDIVFRAGNPSWFDARIWESSPTYDFFFHHQAACFAKGQSVSFGNDFITGLACENCSFTSLWFGPGPWWGGFDPTPATEPDPDTYLANLAARYGEGMRTLASDVFNVKENNLLGIFPLGWVGPPITRDRSFTVGDDFIERGVPCSMTSEGAWQDVPDLPDSTLAVPATPLRIDYCARMQQQYNCRLADISSYTASERTYVFSNASHPVFANSPDQHTTFAVNTVCVPSYTARYCAETFACNSKSAANELRSDYFESVDQAPWSTLDPATGDLTCWDTGLSFKQPFDAPSLDLPTLKDNCLSDIAALEAPIPASAGASDYERLQTSPWGEASGCMNPMQLMVILNAAGEPLRSYRAGMDNNPAFQRSAAIFTRELERWLQVQTMLVNDVAESSAALPGLEPDTDLGKDLEDSLAGWTLLLHPRVSSALTALGHAEGILYSGDYRSAFGDGKPPTQAGWNQGQGLILAMARLSRKQTELARQIVEQAARGGAKEAPPAIGGALRTLSLVDVLMNGLLSSAIEYDSGTEPPWLEDFRNVRALTARDRRAIALAVDAMALGKNPLGIEDEDLPLYFSQIRTDAGSRFTAVSDYLLGDSQAVSAPAPSLVADALAAFEQARDSYLAEEARTVNIENEDGAVYLALDVAKREFGETMLDLCGAEAFPDLTAGEIPDAINDGRVDIETCFVDATNSECEGATALATSGGAATDGTGGTGGATAAKTIDPERELLIKKRNIERDICKYAHLRRPGGTMFFPNHIPNNPDNAALVFWTAGRDAQSAGDVTVYGFGPNAAQTLTFYPPLDKLFTQQTNNQLLRDALPTARVLRDVVHPVYKRYTTVANGSGNWRDGLKTNGWPTDLTEAHAPVVAWLTLFGEPNQGFSTDLDTHPVEAGITLFKHFAGLKAEFLDDKDILRLSSGDITNDVGFGKYPGYEFVREGSAPPILAPPAINLCRNAAGQALPTMIPVVEIDKDTEAVTLTCASIYDPNEVAVVPYDKAAEESMNQAFEDPNNKEALKAAAPMCDLFFPEVAEEPANVLKALKPHECFRGSLGAQTYSIFQLASQVLQAQLDLQALMDEYAASMRSCVTMRATHQNILELTRQFDQQMKGLETARAVLDSISVGTRSWAECAFTAGGVDTVTGFVYTLSGCSALVVAATADIGSIGISASMENIQRDHDLAVSSLEYGIEDSQCFDQAAMILLGVKSQGEAMRAAALEMNAALIDWNHAMEGARQAVTSGNAQLWETEQLFSTFVGQDPWMNRDVKVYKRKMELARRATYLAARAVEYEFQKSLGVRSAILKAKHPDELSEAIDTLREVALTGSINGAQPAELTEVVSLRNNLLQVSSHENAVSGEKAEDQLTRFHQLLNDPRYRVVQNGEFKGVEIPFSLAPLGSIGLGNASGFDIASDNSCGERLWGLNATIVGDETRMYEGLAPQVNLEVRQRNTFYSNLCTPTSADLFQFASTRPSRNLFSIPGVGSGIPDLVGSETDVFAKARIQAKFNIDPATFASDAYVDGQSTELAARLLFGDYSIFIPASALPSVDSTGVAKGDGLRLNEVDDILLRFNYLSVAR